MKRTTIRDPKPQQRPVLWRETGHAGLRLNSPDSFDDRVSENIFDIDGERAEVDIIVHGMNHRLN